LPRTPLLALAAAGLIAACAPVPRQPDPAYCASIFQRYDLIERRSSGFSYNSATGESSLTPGLEFQISRLRQNGCITFSRDLADLGALRAELAAEGFRPSDGGAAIAPVPVHVGVITSIADEARVTQFFRSLGYDTRGVGAERLGRRIYIGPVRSQGALAQAIAVARRAGFVSPYPARYTRL
jgi:hypothetical protein